jgi:hypothetical protein
MASKIVDSNNTNSSSLPIYKGGLLMTIWIIVAIIRVFSGVRS